VVITTDLRYQQEEENSYKERMRKRSEDLKLHEEKVQEMIREEAETIKRLSNHIPDEFQSQPRQVQDSQSLVSVYAGKNGMKGFVDGVLVKEARFSNPTGLVLLDQAVIIADTGE
jgi:hypothetical protein